MKFPESNSYSREDAVSYAVNHALRPNPEYRYLDVHGDGGGDCSNFISQCLKAGGAPMDYTGRGAWWYRKGAGNSVMNDKWSVSWTVAHSLYWCLKIRYERNLPGLKGMEVTNINNLELGDIIQYENSRGIIYHSAIITSFLIQSGMRVPFISQHSFNALDIPYIKPAAKRMHFIKIIVK